MEKRTLMRWLCWGLMISCLGIVGCGSSEFDMHASSVDPTVLPALTTGSNEFAVSLYRRLATERESENLFLSPFSISSALAMTAVGARGATLTEMTKSLRFPETNDDFHSTYGALVQQLNHRDGVELSVANALWAQKGMSLEDGFLQTTNRCYGAGLSEVDFLNKAEAARTVINDWVEEKTRDRIKDLLPPGTLTPLTRLVLTNAIYFKGSWASEFDPDRTHEGVFTLNSGEAVRVPLMSQKEKFRFWQDSTLQLLEMDYVGDDLSMVVLLPRAADGLAKLEEELTSTKIASWLAEAGVIKLDVTLPLFRVESKFQLKDVLQEMGLAESFTPRADFSGINGEKDLFLQDVIHQAYVEVNEEGTEAAAATGVVMGVLSAGPMFQARHPFVFLIRDRETGAILFMGRVTDPR